MTSQLRAELLKIRSTRTTAGIVLGMIGIVLLFSLLTGLLTKRPNLVAVGDQRDLLGVGDFAGVFSALAGIMAVTSEYRYGTIRPTFLFTPRRSRVLEAKVAAGLLTGAVFGIVGGGLGFVTGYACLAGRGIDFVLDGRQITLLLLSTVAGAALWGGIGVGVGAIVRNQVAAIIGLLAWGFVAENLIFGFLPGLGRFGPVHAGNGLIEFSTAHLLGPAAGGLVLVAWAAALSLAGVAVATRRDVD
jgi:ABC-2 type transport system permease protein